METINGRLTFLLENQKDFLSFMKTRYHLFHLSNVFFRDLHYGVMSYLEWKKKPLHYPEAEELTKQLIGELESGGILKNVDRFAFTLQYPDFKKPSVKPAVPAKPAAPVAKPVPPTPKPVATTTPVPVTASEPKEPQQAG
ncbi:MAG: hypothetical protein WEF53_05255 [Bacteroidota bacterium]